VPINFVIVSDADVDHLADRFVEHLLSVLLDESRGTGHTSISHYPGLLDSGDDRKIGERRPWTLGSIC
jgi:hypothetical protein